VDESAVAYELRRKKSTPDGIRRIAEELIEDSFTALLSQTLSRAEAVRAIRKPRKEVRATPRLVRYDLGEKYFRVDDAAFRRAPSSCPKCVMPTW
jgi:hypothetical protein